jgi:hypothetical protein
VNTLNQRFPNPFPDDEFDEPGPAFDLIEVRLGTPFPDDLLDLWLTPEGQAFWY